MGLVYHEVFYGGLYVGGECLNIVLVGISLKEPNDPCFLRPGFPLLCTSDQIANIPIIRGFIFTLDISSYT
jgi:hypothetical protein